MKKVMLFMSDTKADIESDLNLLGDLGVMHVMPFQPAEDESIERIVEEKNQLITALNTLEQYSERESNAKATSADANVLLSQVIDGAKDLIDTEKSLKLQKEALVWFGMWGKMTKADVATLAKRGIYIKLYGVDSKELKTLDDRKDVQIAGYNGKTALVVLLAEDKETTLEFKEESLPDYEAEALPALIAAGEKQVLDIDAAMVQAYANKQILLDALAACEENLNKHNVQYSSLSIEDAVRCYQGFVPVDEVEGLLDAAGNNQWGYVLQDPSDEELEEVPTLVKTPRWAQRVKPVMDFMGLVSGYTEMDVSKIFMLFFTFFTGVLVGDAGYGLIFFLLTLFAHKKTKFKKKVEFELLYTLSIAIMFWGVITGTYFGSETIAKVPFLNNLIIDKMASFGGDSNFLQQLMFIVGAVHLSIGHLQAGWKYKNTIKILGELGWVAIIWALYFVVLQMVLMIPAPSYMLYLLVGGAISVTLFSHTGGNFFKGVLASLANLPLSIINGFSDIISYIRLYAVGLATVLMAASFNELAIGEGISTVLSGVIAVLVLLLGHTLNMVLAAMSVIVHGVRLNMLEYGGHAGVEFSGNEYNPFKLNNKKQ